MAKGQDSKRCPSRGIVCGSRHLGNERGRLEEETPVCSVQAVGDQRSGSREASTMGVRLGICDLQGE